MYLNICIQVKEAFLINYFKRSNSDKQVMIYVWYTNLTQIKS